MLPPPNSLQISLETPLSEKYVVAVCTAKRPDMLRKCLVSLAAMQRIDGALFAIAVVENDSEPLSRNTVEEVAAQTGTDIEYVQETRRGIPFARNKALETCLDMKADWIALIDDDETARPDWLVKLAEACVLHDAEVANGPVYRIYEKEAPYWWKKQLLKPRETGEEITEAPTNNVLIASRIVAPDGLGLRFEELLTNGAEDIDFFRRVHGEGVKMIWADEAFVDEFIPASRVETGRLLNRLVMAACSGTQMKVLREGQGIAIRDHFPKAIRRIVFGSVSALVGLPARLLFGQRGGKILFYGITRICKGWGNLKGLFGIVHSYYHKIDGQ